MVAPAQFGSQRLAVWAAALRVAARRGVNSGCEVKGVRRRGPSCGLRQFTFYRIHLSLSPPSIQFTDQNATERIPGGIVPPLASELCEYSHHAGIASFQTYVAWWIEPEARSCFIVSAVHGPCCAFAVSR